jgi:hypothetical protein
MASSCQLVRGPSRRRWLPSDPGFEPLRRRSADSGRCRPRHRGYREDHARMRDRLAESERGNSSFDQEECSSRARLNLSHVFRFLCSGAARLRQRIAVLSPKGGSFPSKHQGPLGLVVLSSLVLLLC